MQDIVKELQNHALPDPTDEREVLHAPLLRKAAAEIQSLTARLEAAEKERNEWREAAGSVQNSANQLAAQIEALKKDAELLAGLRRLCGHVENQSNTTVCLYQGVDTGDWICTVGSYASVSSSFTGAIKKAIDVREGKS